MGDTHDYHSQIFSAAAVDGDAPHHHIQAGAWHSPILIYHLFDSLIDVCKYCVCVEPLVLLYIP